MTSSFYLSPTDWTGLLWAIKRLIKASLFLALTLKTLFWIWMWKCDVTPPLRSLSTHHLVRAAVCSSQRDFLRKPWSPGSALLPPTGKGLKLWNVHVDKRLLLVHVDLVSLSVSVHYYVQRCGTAMTFQRRIRCFWLISSYFKCHYCCRCKYFCFAVMLNHSI